MPIEVEIPTLGLVEFPDGMSEEAINEASARLYKESTATASAGPATVTRSVERPQSEYEEELNRRFKEFAFPPGPVGGAVGALETGVKSAQQIAPVIIGKELSRLKTTGRFDPPESVQRQAFKDIYGESFRSQIASMEGAEDPDKRADDLYTAYKIRVNDLTKKRNAILDVWTGVAEQLEKEKGQVIRSTAQQELDAAITQRDKWSVFKKYPLQVASSIVLESLPPSIAGGVIGAAAGPAGVAAGVGLGGASMEYSSTLLGEASKAGYDVSQPGGLVAFLDSPAYDAASDKALIRSGIIGAVDTATAGGAGMFIKPVVKKGLMATATAAVKEAGVQAIGGAGGEFLAQAATKEPGEAFDWFDITMEAVGEAVSAVPEAGLKMLSDTIKSDPVAASAAVNGAPATAQAMVDSKEVIPSDTQDQPRIPSGEPQGQATIETQPQQGAGTEAASGGGILQTQETIEGGEQPETQTEKGKEVLLTQSIAPQTAAAMVAAEPSITPEPATKPQIAKLSSSPRKNKLGDPLGTTYHATPEDYASYQAAQARIKEVMAADPTMENPETAGLLQEAMSQNETVKNKYGGMPPQPPAAAPDPILGLLDRAIAATDADPTQLMEGVTGLPVWLTRTTANGVLRVVRAAYLGGKNIAEAIRDGIEWLRQQNIQGFNEAEARSFIEQSMAERGAQTVKTDEEKAMESLDEEQGDTTRKQFAGYRRAGQERPVENIADIQAVNRQVFFDPTGDVTPEKIDQAWLNALRMANPQENEEFNREIRAASGREMGPALLAHDLQHFSFKMVEQGDFSLMNFLRDNWSTLATGGGLTTEAMGRGLRGLVTERTDAELLRQLADVFNWRKANTKTALGVETDEDFKAIKDLLDNVQLTPAEIMEALGKLKGKDGKPVVESIQAAIASVRPSLEPEESWQDRTARSILDKMESSQTEWVKPDKPKNEIREYVKEALRDTTWPSIDAPDNTTRNVEAYLDKVTRELVDLGVSEPYARRLAWEIHRERLNRWSLKNLRAAKRNSPDTIVQGFLEQLVNISPKAPQNAVRKILSDARRRKLVFNDTIQPDEWKGQLSDQLVAAGVTDQLANRVADELYVSKVPEFATEQAARFQQAGDNVPAIVDALLKALRQQPYRAQNAEWRLATARQYFEDAGLSPSRAEDAAKAFDNVFVAMEPDARAKAAKKLIGEQRQASGKPKPTGQERAMEKLKEAVRIGLTDPNRTWEDTIAATNKWKGFTASESNRLAEWVEALDGALPHEYAKLYTKINKLLSTKTEPQTAHELASFYSSNQLSGTATQLLSYLNPAFSSITKSGVDAISGIVDGDLGRPLFSAKALITSLKQWSKEFHFAWKYDAYTAQTLRAVEKLENLYALMERGFSDFNNKDLSAPKRAWGLIRYFSSFVDIVRQSLQSADQAWQSTIKEWRALVGGRELMIKAGIAPEEVEGMFADAYMASEGYYREAVAAGKDDLDAKMEARDRLWQDMEAMFKDRLGDTNGSSVLLTARLESELEVGNHRGEGGWLNDFLTGIQTKFQAKSPLIYRLILGFPRINYNILSRAAWYSPWGWKRLKVDLDERKKGIPPEERSYKQSMVTELQRRQRMIETITGTVATGLISALYFSEMDDKDDERTVWFDMEGPINPKERSVWLKAGHRPNTIGVKAGDKRISINWSRGGIESIQVPIAMLASYEDRRINSKDPSVLEAAARLISLLGFTQTGRRDYLTEKGFAYTAASKMSGFVPFAGSLRTINKLVDTRDTTTIEGILIAATPVAPALGGQPALNVLGEPVASDMPGLKSQRLGVPVNITTPLPLYQLMASKSETPPYPRRDVVEKEVQRPITDEDWYKYVKTYGGVMKERMTDTFESLKDMESDQFNKQLDRFAVQAKRAAMAEVR